MVGPRGLEPRFSRPKRDVLPLDDRPIFKILDRNANDFVRDQNRRVVSIDPYDFAFDVSVGKPQNPNDVHVNVDAISMSIGCIAMDSFDHKKWVQGRDSNPQPSDYETDKLPLLYPATFFNPRRHTDGSSGDNPVSRRRG